MDEDEVENENRRDQGGGTEEAASDYDGVLHACGIRKPVSGTRPEGAGVIAVLPGGQAPSGSAQRSSQTRSNGCMGPHTASGGSMTALCDTVT